MRRGRPTRLVMRDLPDAERLWGRARARSDSIKHRGNPGETRSIVPCRLGPPRRNGDSAASIRRGQLVLYFPTTSIAGFAMMKPFTGNSGVNEITPSQPWSVILM